MLLVLSLLACAPQTDRLAGERFPLDGGCDETDPASCMLPFPSNHLTVVDESTATGLRLAWDDEALDVLDDASFINEANGYSRVTGVAVAFDEVLDADQATQTGEESLTAGATLQVFNAQTGSARYGERQPYWSELVDAGSLTNERNLLIGRPVGVLEADADHVFVVLDSVGSSEAAPRQVRVALGVEEPRGRKEQALAAWYAPTAAFLDEVGVDRASVLRVSEFTTRSADDPTKRLHSMMDTLDGALDGLQVEVDSVSTTSHPAVAFIVRGRLTGAPNFLTDAGGLDLDEDGRPQITGAADIEFRMSVPATTSDYKVALYGHGTGGDVTDSSFDEDLAEHGIAKLNLRFDGWTGDEFLGTLSSFTTFWAGSERSTAGLLQSIAGGTVLISALDGALGEVLAADTLDGEPNPMAGIRPRTDKVVWVGGSLGGTLGAVIVAADPRLQTAVLNVPGTGWSHMIPHSLLYDVAVGAALEHTYGSPMRAHLAMLSSQVAWDDVDGAVYAEEALEVGGSFLLQESMGDPVLPNLGTNILASALGAVQLEPVLEPIPGLESSDQPQASGAALEQFRVPYTGDYDVHGFAARNTIAGDAALEQILIFLQDAWEGETPMQHPSLCTDYGLEGSCDFTEAWDDD